MSLSILNSSNLIADELAKSLAVALQNGLTDKAADLAKELSKLKPKCDVSVIKEEDGKQSKEIEFSVKVHVEDRISEQCFINLTVKASNTIRDLKRKVMLLHNLPMEVQRWIIGKKIYPDETRLQQCGVKRSGHTLYLYLVTAHSVGLDKATYEAQKQAICLLQNQQPGSMTPQLSVQSLNRNSMTGGGDSLEQTSVVPLANRNSSSLSLSSFSPGSLRLQEMLNTPNPLGMVPNAQLMSQQGGMSGAPAESFVNHASPGISADTWAHNNTALNSTGSVSSNANVSSQQNANEATPEAQLSDKSGLLAGESEEKETEVGWYCPQCTFLNLPLWPGCEICNEPCPADYQVPEDYELTERERLRLQEEQMLERLTRELSHEDLQDDDDIPDRTITSPSVQSESYQQPQNHMMQQEIWRHLRQYQGYGQQSQVQDGRFMGTVGSGGSADSGEMTEEQLRLSLMKMQEMEVTRRQNRSAPTNGGSVMIDNDRNDSIVIRSLVGEPLDMGSFLMDEIREGESVDWLGGDNLQDLSIRPNPRVAGSGNSFIPHDPPIGRQDIVQDYSNGDFESLEVSDEENSHV